METNVEIPALTLIVSLKAGDSDNNSCFCVARVLAVVKIGNVGSF